MVYCDYYWLRRGRVLDQLKCSEQGNVIAAELVTTRLVTTRRQAVLRSVFNRVGCPGRMVRNRRYAVPAARIRESYEQRKHPQPKNAGGHEFAMAPQ